MTRLNLGSGIYIIDGFDNLDPTLDPPWRFEDGLGQYPDESVECACCYHALMHLPLPNWPALFAEVARVLEPGGVFRVGEDSTADPESERYGGFPGAVTLTSPALVLEHLERAGLRGYVVSPEWTYFRDKGLIQNLHGGPPKTFTVEGFKP